MRLVSKVKGVTPHVLAEGAASLEISCEEGAVYLFRLDAAGRYLTDTFHQSIDEAMRQAKFEFSVEPSDWAQVEG